MDNRKMIEYKSFYHIPLFNKKLNIDYSINKKGKYLNRTCCLL